MIYFFRAGRPNPRRKPLKPAHFFFWRTSPQNFSGAGKTFFKGAERSGAAAFMLDASPSSRKGEALSGIVPSFSDPGSRLAWPG
jgi:hypothetical protein